MAPDLYDHDQEPAVISKPLSDLLLKQSNPAELMALYWFYYYTAKWQKTNQPQATNSYVASGLHWSCNRVSKVGKRLEELGLIKKIAYWCPDKKHITGHYVKVYFLWGRDNTEKATHKESNSVVNHTTNALSSNRLNALSSNKRIVLRNKDEFDPLDLPTHLAKHPTVVKAWAEFVEYRHKVKRKPLSKMGCTKLFKKIISCQPEDIVSAIDTSIESGWTGIFPKPSKNPTVIRTVQGDLFPVKLTPEGKQLIAFACSVLGNEIIRPRCVQETVDQMESYYTRIAKMFNPHNPRQGPTEHLPWKKFFGDWLDFLQEKQSSGFTLRSVRDLELTNCRWREYIQRCERFTGYNFTTGKRIE